MIWDSSVSSGKIDDMMLHVNQHSDAFSLSSGVFTQNLSYRIMGKVPSVSWDRDPLLLPSPCE